jgi:hypothetical protein
MHSRYLALETILPRNIVVVVVVVAAVVVVVELVVVVYFVYSRLHLYLYLLRKRNGVVVDVANQVIIVVLNVWSCAYTCAL